jgi:hypothetical protein
MQHHLVVAINGHVCNIVEQVSPWIFPKLVLRFVLQQVEGTFNVLGRERLAIMPGHAFPQLECQCHAGRIPGPARCQFGHDVAHTVLWLVLVVNDEVIE